MSCAAVTTVSRSSKMMSTAPSFCVVWKDAVGLSACDLSKLRKNDAPKQVVVSLLRKRTTVRNRWLSRQSAMGHEARVSQSVRAVAQARDGKLLCLREALEEMLKITD